MFTIKIETENSAFEDSTEVQRILEKVIDKLNRGLTEGRLVDINGNKVGNFKLTKERENEREKMSEKKFTPESIKAFNQAIKHGFLSDDPDENNYAGHYMYMGFDEHTAELLFKDILSREYIRFYDPETKVYTN